MHITYHAINKV